MYCINCGVKLSDTEQKCPLCGTSVYHPEIKQKETAPLYPKDRMQKRESIRKILSGAIIFLFLIPLMVCFFVEGMFGQSTKKIKELDDNSPKKTDHKDPKTIAKLMVEGRYCYPYIPEGFYADLRDST